MEFRSPNPAGRYVVFSCIWALLAALALVAPVASSTEVHVTGRIELPGGGPAEGVEVHLMPTISSYTFGQLMLAGELFPEAERTARTDSAGRFRLAAPHAGMWRLQVTHKSYRPMDLYLIPLLEDITAPNLELIRETPVRVRLTDLSGTPLEGGYIVAPPPPRHERARVDNQERWNPTRRRGIIGEDGFAEVGRGPEESLHLYAFAPGHLEVDQTVPNARTATLALPAAEPRRIRVEDSRGEPAEQVLARLGDRNWRLGFTDTSGEIDLPLPATGELEVQLFAPDGRSLNRSVDPTEWPTEGPLRVTLPDRTLKSGQVLNSETSEPIEGALVWVSQEPTDYIVTDAGGGYSIAVPESRKVRLWATARDYIKDTNSIEAEQVEIPAVGLQPTVRVAGVVVDDSGDPVPGASIQAVVNFAVSRNASWVAARQVDRSEADERGRFAIGRLSPKVAYLLRVSKAGFAPQDHELPDPRSAAAAPLRITLESGRMLIGSAVDQAGAPVPGARVEIRRAASSGSIMAFQANAFNRPPATEVATDANGQFSVRDLAAANFDLRISATGHATAELDSVAVSADESSTDVGEITLEPGFAIEGRVVDSDGSGLDGAKIHAQSAERKGIFSLRGESPEPVATSDLNGLFTVPDRSQGERVNLSASLEGYAGGSANRVEAPTTQPLVIELLRTSRVLGSVVDAAGRGVEGATLALRVETTSTGRTTHRSSARGETDADGNFVLDGASPGNVTLSAVADGFRETELRDLEIEPERDLEGVRVVLEVGGVVTGRVTDPLGKPIPGAYLRVADSNVMSIRFSRRGAAADARGVYRMVGLGTGTMKITAQHEDFKPVTEEIEVGEGENTRDFQLEPGVAVSGRVIGPDGEPVVGANVGATSSMVQWSNSGVVSGVAGDFEIAGLAEGVYTVTAQREGLAPTSLDDLQVGPGGLSDIELRLEKGLAIVGSILGVDRDRLDEVQIFAVRQPATFSHGRVLAEEGTYRVDGVGPGEYFVRASYSGASVSEVVEISPGVPETVLDLDFPEGLVLSGVVLKEEEPLEAIQVIVTGIDVASGASGESDNLGRFEVRGLEPGNYIVAVRSFRSGLNHQEEVDIFSNRTITVRLATARVAGRVVDAVERSPLAGAQLTLERLDTPTGASFNVDSTTSTDTSGYFRFAEASEGVYRLLVQREGFAPTETQVAVTGGTEQPELELELEPSEGTVLFVTRPTGDVAREFYATAFNAAGQKILAGRFFAGSDGGSRVHLPDGTWDLSVTDGSSATTTITATAPGEPVSVQLSDPSRVTIIVPELETDGARVTVRVSDPQGRQHRSARWLYGRGETYLRGGRVQLTTLPPGNWTVHISAADGRSWQTQIALQAGENPDVVIP